MEDIIKPSIVNCDYKEKYWRIFWENRILQSPWMLLKLLIGLIYSSVVYLFLLKDPTDEDIISYVENTTLAWLLVDQGQGKCSLEIEGCKIKSFFSTSKLKSFKMDCTRHTTGGATIQKFLFNGDEITDRTLMMEILFFFHTSSAHTKFHLYSNGLTEYIIDNDVTQLLPSTKTSLPLHNALTKSLVSPVADEETRTKKPWIYRYVTQVYSVEITRESLIKESYNKSPFEMLSKENQESCLPFVRYLAECKEGVRKALSEETLPAGLLEPLFHHMIVHAIDHDSCYSRSWKLRFGAGEFLGASCSGVSVFRSLMFRWQMVKPSLQPICSNKIKNVKNNKFYDTVYKAVKCSDEKYGFSFGDIVTASVMY